MPLGARDGGSPSWRSTHCTAPYAASPCPPSATLARARTNFSLIQNESENDKCLLPAGAYPMPMGLDPAIFAAAVPVQMAGSIPAMTCVGSVPYVNI
jgi:hypothetical protein